MSNQEFLKESWINSLKYSLLFTGLLTVPIAVFYYITIYAASNTWLFFPPFPISLLIGTLLHSHFCFYFKNPNYITSKEEASK